MWWSDWYECSFDSNGEIDTRQVENAPNDPGLYAIATKTSRGSYTVEYIGMSKKSMRKRLQAHFSGKETRGNRVIRELLNSKKDGRSVGFSMLNALYFCYVEVPKDEVKELESRFIRSMTPIANLQENSSMPKLPIDLEDANVEVELDDD
ncbi:MAG: GIY-YIG nuclease family protein [Microcoleus sp. PH2017_10_PVI_O_A]|uniref:GIY-YIG nuclease family protein n=1 Tax=unclassified Microcoleus TaxID=2642155 RepID=UPI001D754138|nr:MULTISPECIES: GIY-YIG nuclease family protein [unclassified Microcoleus]TAE82277.1 MAG: GIY-YIG nuclease family protein [Oscillatoriales cyanobacterium]MCC3406799.1 GIY-YIG nuclease family protein [Microcoleus sp. PH2017_10_PVI_O_A]MCC3460934.1 GIY-YIG nuclease family protein [Microcoleus sp. PH2017_11_PCY_U_A]MCC3479456.1 GIY-YIG nuclease family protein [Microcoleus sp. PH2017_12_PCY_D_A]MCC3560298.1 GIY-YIG nuclease family protein [Microcoleus sp. PH2017_27_LUM_O_A]